MQTARPSPIPDLRFPIPEDVGLENVTYARNCSKRSRPNRNVSSSVANESRT